MRYFFFAAVLALGPLSKAVGAEHQQTHRLDNCDLHVQVTPGTHDHSPHFIMVDGVPLSGRVFSPLAHALHEQLGATVQTVDFPHVGRSHMHTHTPQWEDLRRCFRQYLSGQPDTTLVVADLGLPLVAPLIADAANVKGIVVLNSPIRMTKTTPPFPMSALRCCGVLALPLSYLMPNSYFEHRVRDIGFGRPHAVSDTELALLIDEMRSDGGPRRLTELLSHLTFSEREDNEISAALALPLPQLLIWGTADPVLGDAYRDLPALGDQHTLTLVPTGRHFLMADHAGEITDIIVSWLSERL